MVIYKLYEFTKLQSLFRLQKHEQEITQRGVIAYTRSTSKYVATEQNQSAATKQIRCIEICCEFVIFAATKTLQNKTTNTYSQKAQKNKFYKTASLK